MDELGRGARPVDLHGQHIRGCTTLSPARKSLVKFTSTAWASSPRALLPIPAWTALSIPLLRDGRVRATLHPYLRAEMAP